MQARSVTDADRVPWGSLANAVRLILHRNGCDVDMDDLHAALALPWMFCAAPKEPRLEQWALYARDRHLPAVGRLFGLTIRPVHPPETAKGLDDAAEFFQHFDASYRPLILRALENDQPVLAWRGWPGCWEAAWGILRRPCASNVGFMGSIALHEGSTVGLDGPSKSGEGDAVELVDPPTQVYVVERVQPTKPDAPSLFGVVLEHARAALADAAVDAFGVLTGTPAWDAWVERIRRIDRSGSDASLAPLANGHSLLARCIVDGHRSAERFLARQAAPAADASGKASAPTVRHNSNPSDRRSATRGNGRSRFTAQLDAWRRACQIIVTYLSAPSDEAFVREAMATPKGRRTLLDQIETARDASQALSRVLSPIDADLAVAR